MPLLATKHLSKNSATKPRGQWGRGERTFSSNDIRGKLVEDAIVAMLLMPVVSLPASCLVVRRCGSNGHRSPAQLLFAPNQHAHRLTALHGLYGLFGRFYFESRIDSNRKLLSMRSLGVGSVFALTSDRGRSLTTWVIKHRENMEATVAGNDGKRARTSSLRVKMTRPKRRCARSETRSTTEEPAVETTLAAQSPISDAKPRLLLILESIDMKLLKAHFDKDSEGDVNEDIKEGGVVDDEVEDSGDINEDDEQGGCEPFLATDEFVSQNDLREHCEHSAYENSLFSLRFLELSDDGKLWIVELPTSEVHERAAEKFNLALFLPSPDLNDYCDTLGHTTIYVNGRNIKADKTYGPLPNIPNSVRPQALQPGDEWITFVLEVGRSQRWDSLCRRALRWYNYTGMQYVLLISISPEARSMSYELYEVNLAPGNVATQLPAPAAGYNTIRHKQGVLTPVLITLDSRRILGIPAGQLPQGVPANLTVDLRAVLNIVRRAHR
jgi:hypothetical protein